MPVSARKPSLSSKGLSRAYGSPVAPKTPTPNSAKKRPEWNDRSTDDEKYKLSKEEMLKRKKLYISKHNVFASGSTSLPGSARKRKGSTRAMRPRSAHSGDAHSEAGYMRDPLLEMTSLDYLSEDGASSDESDGSAASSDEERSDEEQSSRRVPLGKTIDLSKFVTVQRSLHKEASSPAPQMRTPDMKTSSRGRTTPLKSSTPKLSVTPVKKVAPAKFVQNAETPVGTDVLEMLRALYGELIYYEELSGRRSVFDFSELNSILDTYTEVEEDGVHMPRKHVSMGGVVRYLIQLVCQSMTYLLQSEVKLSQQQTDYESLSKRVEVLTTLVTAGHGLPGSARAPPAGREYRPAVARQEEVKKEEPKSAPAFVFGAGGQGVDQFTTPTRREASFSSATTPSPAPSQLSQRMGTATSDWLFATPISAVESSEQTELEESLPIKASVEQPKAAGSSGRDAVEWMQTPVAGGSPSTGNAAEKTFDLFGRERLVRAPASGPSPSAFNKESAHVRFELAEDVGGTPTVSGRPIQQELVASSADKSGESNYYFDMLHSKKDEDETDKMYQENLVSVARKLYAESLERSHLEESPERQDAVPYRLPPRNPAPVTRVEKLQKSLLANRHAAPAARAFLTDVQSSYDRDSGGANGWPSRSMEQVSFGSIPPPPPPAPHSAPVHPFLDARYKADFPRVTQPRQVFDATSGSY